MGTIIEIEPMRELLYADWDALDASCSGLDEHQWATPTCLPGWTVKDVLAHIAGIERMIEGDPAPTIDVSHLGHIRNDFAAAVEVWVEDQRHLSGEAVLDGFRDVVARRRAALAAMTQADFDAPSWTPVGRDETYGRFMRIRHFDIYLHELDIRDALGIADRADMAAMAMALPEADSALGYIASRRAALADGSVVRIDLTGPVVRTYVIGVVDGRGHLLEGHDREPDVTLAMSDALFLRLTGGRTRPGDHLGVDLEIAGDQAMGMHLAAQMAVTV